MTTQRLCHSDEIPEQGSKGFIVNGQKIFGIKKHGKIYLYRNSCPHIGIALEWVEDQFLDQSNSMIQCANHGALFVIENGKCVVGPCSGQSLVAVPFEILNDHIELKQR
jgi:nitrite reductase/ring-hydroxylating ferredoxin subunit